MSKPEESLPLNDQSREDHPTTSVETEQVEGSPSSPESVDVRDAEVIPESASEEIKDDGESPSDPDNGDDTSDGNVPENADKRPVRYAIVGLVVGIFVGFCFNFAVMGVQEIIRSSNATVISVAVADCNLEGREGIIVSDGNKHLNIDTKGAADSSGATTQNAVCLVHALQIPENVLAKLNETQPDGKSHKEEWDQREITWEFTRDKGIRIDLLIKS